MGFSVSGFRIWGFRFQGLGFGVLGFLVWRGMIIDLMMEKRMEKNMDNETGAGIDFVCGEG